MWRAITPVLVGFVLLAGCSQGPRFNPVQGKVTWRGKPAAGARVIFHPVSESQDQPKPTALVGEDGSFHLGTRAPGDGAPAGEYKVTIDWSDRSDKALLEADKSDTAPKSTDKLQGRYADPKRSTLHATIKEGENDLPPFELK